MPSVIMLNVPPLLHNTKLEKFAKNKHSSSLVSFISCKVIFFVTSEWAQYARVLHYTGVERFAGNKRSSLSYEGNEVL
jgi:hypothetical protein